MDIQQVSQLLSLIALSKTQEEIDLRTNQIASVLEQQESIFIFFEILKNPNLYTKGATVFLLRALNLHWDNLDNIKREQICTECLQFLNSRNFTQDVLDSFLGVIDFICSKRENEWSELFSFIFNLYQSGNDINLITQLLSTVIESMSCESITSSLNFLLGISALALKNGDISIKLQGVTLFQKVCISINIQPIPIDHIVSIISIAQITPQLNSSQCSKLWDAISSLLSHDYVPPDLVSQILDFVIQFGSNRNLDVNVRSITCYSIFPILTKLPHDFISKYLSISFDVVAYIIQQDDTLPSDQFEDFKVCAQTIDHEIIFPIIQEKISMAFQSNSPYHQITALLLFTILIQQIPDFSYKNIEEMVKYILMSITSDNDLFKQAGLTVITQFDESSILVPYCHQLIPGIIPNLISTNPDIRSLAFLAFRSITEIIDTEYPQLFQQYISLIPKIVEDNIIPYLSIMPFVIDNCEEISDEELDQLILFITQIMKSDNLDQKAAALQIGIAILHKDETQLEFVLSIIFPAVSQCINSNDVYHVEESIDFLGNITMFLRYDIINYIQPFIPQLLETIKNKKANKKIYISGIDNITKIIKFLPDELKQQLFKEVFPEIINGITNGGKNLRKYSIKSIKRICKLLTTEESIEVFKLLYEIMTKVSDLEIINLTFDSLKKILQFSNENNINLFLESSINIIKLMINSELPILQGKPLITSPICTDLLPHFCSFIDSFSKYNTIINDELCKYFLQWMNKDNELELFEITGIFTEFIKNQTISNQMMQIILQNIMNKVNDASDSGLIQNLAFLFNLLIQMDQNLIHEIIKILPIIEKWRQICINNKFGYQLTLSNIASLYLTIAARIDVQDDIILYGINEFPPYDELETNTMAENIIKIVPKINNQKIIMCLALAFAKFVAFDDAKIQKSKITKENFDALIQIFRNLCSNKEILMQIQASVGKQRAKLRKIMSILQ